MLHYPAPLRAIPYGAPAIENRLLRVPMRVPTYGITDSSWVDIPSQVLYSLTVHHFTDINRPAQWVVGTQEGHLLVLSYRTRSVHFLAPSSEPLAAYESEEYDVEDFLVMDRHYTRRLLYELALAS